MAKKWTRERTLDILSRIPKKIRARVRETIEAEAAALVATQKRLVPKKTGRLADAIRYEMGNVALSSSANLAAGGTRTKSRRAKGTGIKGGGGVVVGDPDLTATLVAGNYYGWYARFVEFGTAPHKVGGKYKWTTHGGTTTRQRSMHPGTKPHPFFFGPFRARKRLIRRRVAKALRQAIKEAAT